MRLLLICGLIFLFSSCKQSAIKQSFSAADSVVVHFKDEQAGIITKTVQTAEANAINRIVEFIDAKETEEFKCGYDGKIFFFNKGQRLQEVDFKMKDAACNHFVFFIEREIDKYEDE